MQTQLAQLHEKYGIEVLKSEQLETMNKENQKISNDLKSEVETLTKKNEELEHSNNVKLNKITELDGTISALEKNHRVQSKEIGFFIQCPSHCGETSVNCENVALLPNMSGSFELILKWNPNRTTNPLVCIKPKVNKTVSFNLSVAVSVLSKTKKTSTFVSRSKM